MKAILVAALVSCVASGSINQWADKYCQAVEKLSSQHMIANNKAAIEKAFGDFTTLFTDQLDCSQDPNNKVIGYDLQGASFADCQQAAANANHNFNKFAMSDIHCLEKIIDEDDDSAVVWLEFSNSGEYMNKHKGRAAVRFAFQGDKCNSYHSIFDSYNWLQGSETLVETPMSATNIGVSMLAVSVIFALVAVAAGKKMSKKTDVLLENEIVA